MTDIQRYEINDAGELPVSYGRYVHWEDVEDLFKEMQEEIDRLQDEVSETEASCCNYEAWHEDGRADGLLEGRRLGILEAVDALRLLAAK